MKGMAVEHLKELGLHGEGKLAYFIEEQGALVGQLEHARLAAFGRAGEGPLLVAEKFRFHERHGDGPAVDRDEGLGAASAHLVYGLGGKGLAGPRFSEDEGDGLGAGGLGSLFAQAAHGRAVADEARVHLRFKVFQPGLVRQRLHFQIGQLALKGFQFGHVPDGGDDPPHVALLVENGSAGVQTALAVGIVVKHGHRTLLDERAQGDAGFKAPLVHGFGDVFADDLLGAQARDAFHRLVDAQGDAVGVDDPDAVVDRVEEHGELLPRQFGHPGDVVHGDAVHCDKPNNLILRRKPSRGLFPADNIQRALPMMGDKLARTGFLKAFLHLVKAASPQPGEEGRALRSAFRHIQDMPQCLVYID